MIQRFLPIALLGVAAISNTGCNSNSFKKVNGIEYQIVNDKPGKNAKMGDIIEVNIVAKCDTYELGNSWKQGQLMTRRVEEVKQRGDLGAIFPLLSVGDSAVVRLSCDTLLKNAPKDQTQFPPWLKKGKFIDIRMSVASIQTMEEYQGKMKKMQDSMMAVMKAKADAQMPVDDKLLQEYFTKNNLKPTKTASGMYYMITKPGTGDNIKAGQNVTMNYTGKTMDGKPFDSNTDPQFKHVEPFSFVVGSGQVIKGWDEGVQLLKKGSKGMFFIPSPLGYGPNGTPELPANSILIFDVEVTNVKNAEAPPAQAGGPDQAPPATK